MLKFSGKMLIQRSLGDTYFCLLAWQSCSIYTYLFLPLRSARSWLLMAKAQLLRFDIIPSPSPSSAHVRWMKHDYRNHFFNIMSFHVCFCCCFVCFEEVIVCLLRKTVQFCWCKRLFNLFQPIEILFSHSFFLDDFEMNFAFRPGKKYYLFVVEKEKKNRSSSSFIHWFHTIRHQKIYTRANAIIISLKVTFLFSL